MSNTTKAPRWSLTSVYPSFDSAEYKRDIQLFKERIDTFSAEMEKPLPDSAKEFLALIELFESAGDIAENLSSYSNAIYTADTKDARALSEINALETAFLPLGKAAVIFRKKLAEQKDEILKLAKSDPSLTPYLFYLSEAIEKASFQMSSEMEDLANDLSRSGADAWSRLHDVMTATAQGLWDSATGERKTVVELRELARSPDRNIRERAYKAELSAWADVEIPVAAALNGVKGTTITLDQRRGWKNRDGSYDVLRKSCFQSRISEKTLHALIEALEASLPVFRRYLHAKAKLLGVPVCAFYDLFAPVGNTSEKKWSWEESADFIVKQFNSFDPGMGTFARHAFEFSWIDAEIRDGKIGGAYCTGFPLKGESRILSNFDGSFDSVTTTAHELGHAWHHEVLKELPGSLSHYPMTLAETASIFAETLVFEGALKKAGAEERLGLIEGNIKDSCQVTVDILSRFYFEKALFERRAAAELSPEELCAIMTEAQKKTYGSALDPALLHPYMWAVKTHYYIPSLGFYNYPYAFGLLFSLGLYAKIQTADDYRKLLKLTGRCSAEEVAMSAGFNTEDGTFWNSGISIIEKRVEELEGLADV